MNKTTLKGILSTTIGGLLVYFLFFWDKNDDILDFLIWFIVSSILGYMLIAPFTMSKKELKKFESKFDKWFEKENSIRK